MIILEIAGIWLLLGVVTIALYNAAKIATIGRHR